MKVAKRLSDVTYEILDVGRKTKKIVHFDQLKKSIVKPRAHVLSESEHEDEVLSETESTDFETTSAKLSSKPIKHKKSLSYNLTNKKAMSLGSANTLSASSAGCASRHTPCLHCWPMS